MIKCLTMIDIYFRYMVTWMAFIVRYISIHVARLTSMEGIVMNLMLRLFNQEVVQYGMKIMAKVLIVLIMVVVMGVV